MAALASALPTPFAFLSWALTCCSPPGEKGGSPTGGRRAAVCYVSHLALYLAGGLEAQSPPCSGLQALQKCSVKLPSFCHPWPEVLGGCLIWPLLALPTSLHSIRHCFVTPATASVPAAVVLAGWVGPDGPAGAVSLVFAP